MSREFPRISANFREFPVKLSSSVREWYLRIGVGTREVDLATEKATKQSATFSPNCPRTASSKKQTYSKEDKPLLQATNKLAIDANYINYAPTTARTNTQHCNAIRNTQFLYNTTDKLHKGISKPDFTGNCINVV